MRGLPSGTVPTRFSYLLESRKSAAGSHGNDQVSAVVHSLRTLLAAGADGAGALSHRVASASAVPDCGDCRGRRAGVGERDHLFAGTAVTGDLIRHLLLRPALRPTA